MKRYFVFTCIFLYYFPVLAQYSVSYTGSFNLENNSPITLEVYEDSHAEVPIGFDFEFFGNTYDHVWVDFHGFLRFGTGDPFFCCDGQFLPDSDLPNNLIAACWTDPETAYDDGNGNHYNEYSYETINSAPNRVFIVTFNFYTYNCSPYYYGQVKLFEGSNIIEIHTSEWNIFNDHCGGGVTQGIENEDGTTAFFHPDRNSDSGWTAENDFISFIPVNTSPTTDMGVHSLVYNSLCSGQKDIWIWVRNNGNIPVDSFELAWEWENVFQNDTLIHVNINPGDFYQINLGQQNLDTTGSMYSIRAWTFNPNGGADNDIFNDTLAAVLKVGLSGIYTIGGTNPDYITIQEAIDDLHAFGACDTVIFNIRPGTYQGPLLFTVYPFLHVTFQAENGDSSSVIITHDGEYSLRLQNSFQNHFRNLTFQNTSLAASNVVQIDLYSIWNSFESCNFIGKNNPSVKSSANAVIKITHHTGVLTFKNCLITGGSYGVFFEDYNDNFRDNILLKGNEISGFNQSGIYAAKTIHLRLENNLVISNLNPYAGIEIRNDNGNPVVQNNNITLHNTTGYGIYVNQVEGTNLFVNNMVSTGITGNGERYGIYTTNSSDKLFYNTIHIYGSNNSLSTTYRSENPDSLVNNIFTNFSGGNTYEVLNPVVSNHNNLFNTGPGLAKINGLSFSTLNEIRQTGYETNSVSLNPVYVSDENLHVAQSGLNRRALPLVQYITDIDEEIRDSNFPDIGADEFTGPQFDLAITELISPSQICEVTQEIIFVVHNEGESSVDSFMVAYDINNGIEKDSFWVYQNLSPQTSDTISGILVSLLGGYQHSVTVWVKWPNGMNDEFDFNDTLHSLIVQPFQGVITVGGSSPDFTDIQSAFDMLSDRGVCGPVTINIRDGIYNERANLGSVPGVSALNHIVVQSESMDTSAVLIQYFGNNQDPYVMRFTGVSHLTIRHLKIKNQSVIHGHGLFFREGCDSVFIHNCAFTASPGNPSGAATHIFITYSDLSKNVSIYDNVFEKGQNGIFCWNCDRVKIYNNKIFNSLYAGIRLSQTKNIEVVNNFIDRNSVYNSPCFDSNVAHEQFLISGNTFLNRNYGNSLLINNHNFGVATGNTLLYNNFLFSHHNKGLGIWNSDNISVWFNNLHTTGTLANQSYAIELVNTDSLDIRNNIFKNNTIKLIHQGSITPSVISWDYNLLYSQSQVLGNWGANEYNNFVDWKSGTGFDANSYFADPQFYSDTDLHVLSDTIDGKAQVIENILIDIDGDPRNNVNPDIGADEIGSVPLDAGIISIMPQMKFRSGSQQVKAVVRNFGTDTITDMIIQWSLNGVNQTQVIYQGNLLSLQTDTVILDTIVFQLNVPYSIIAKSFEPNQQPDPYPSNDSIMVVNLYASVSDTITIGSGGEISTIADALSAIQNGGILDSVHFHMLPGMYNQTVSIAAHSAFQCSTPVYFESQNGSASSVVWSNTGLMGVPLILNGADGLIFKNLTFRAAGNTYTTAVQIANHSDCNSFLNCVFESESNTVNNTLVTSNYSNNRNNLFQSCHFSGGNQGAFFYFDDSLSIQNCFFQNQRTTGLFVQGQSKGLKIYRNQISLLPSGNNPWKTGIILSATGNHKVRVEANDIQVQGWFSRGIHTELINPVSETAIVANNFVKNTGLNSAGLSASYCGNIKFMFNSVLSGGDQSTCFTSGYNESGMVIKNNIFYNKTGGTGRLVLNLQNAAQSWYSDYNNLYSDSDLLVKLNNATFENLEQWQVSGKDTSSISENPAFVSDLDLHVTSSFLNGKASPDPEILFDYDGEARDTLMPDIGADEFTPLSLDVGILAVNNPVMPFPSGNNFVFIKFQNNGIDTLTSMMVDWTVNDIPQPTYYWTGVLPPAATYDSLDIGIYNFLPYQDFDVKIWVHSPNGGNDQFSMNDTLMVHNLIPALGGTYTIGGFQGDFLQVRDAVKALNEGGAYTDVHFRIRSGIYTDTIRIIQFAGSSCTREIVFESESEDKADVIISNLGFDQPTIFLDGADGITFKNLSIESVNPAHRRAVQISGGAHCNRFESNGISGLPSTEYLTSTHAVIHSPTSQDSNIVIINNQISGGSTGIIMEGDNNTVVQGNTFLTQNYSAFYTFFCQNTVIERNHITHTVNSPFIALNITYHSGLLKIHANNIKLSQSNKTGIHVDMANNTSVHSNIYNNFISIYNTIGISRGIELFGMYNAGIYFNSIRIESSNQEPFYSLPLYLFGTESVDIKNNIFASISHGFTLYSNSATSFQSDYNNFFKSTENNLIFAGTHYHDLPSWKNATMKDAHSLNQNPAFLAPDDLHTHSVLLDSAGVAINNIDTDIEGDVRSNPPDIGADEFDILPTDDAGIAMIIDPVAPFNYGNHPITVVIKNYGGNPLTSADVRLTMNGVEQNTYSWTGNLQPGQCDTITIDTFHFQNRTRYELYAWTESPNGNADDSNINDTLKIPKLYPGLSGSYTLGGLLPDFNTFQEFSDALEYGGITANVILNIRNGNYSHHLKINEFPKSNQTLSLVIQSETLNPEAVTLSGNVVNREIVRLEGTSNVTIKAIKILCPSSEGIKILRGSHHITIDSCFIVGGGQYLVHSPSSKEEFLHFKNNRFTGGSFALYLEGNVGNHEDSLTISGNIFINQIHGRVYVFAQKNLSVSYNRTQESLNPGANQFYIWHTSGHVKIHDNKIIDNSLSGSGFNIWHSSGIPGNHNQFYNNYIYHGSVSDFNGLYIFQSGYWNIDHNTIHLKNGTPLRLVNNVNQSFQVRNNILKTDGVSPAHVIQNNLTGSQLDYNNLMSNGSVLIQYAGTSYIDRTSFSLATGFEINGFTVDPLFVHAGSPAIKQHVLNNSGVYLPYVNLDIEGISRNQPPDIGCLEFYPPNQDIGIKRLLSPVSSCSLGNEIITISIQNYGSQDVSGFNVGFQIDNGVQITENVGNLQVLAGDTTVYSFTTTGNFSSIGHRTIHLSSHLSNDEDPSNNEVQTQVIHFPAITQSPYNLLPANESVDLETSVLLSWFPVSHATLYDVYVWQPENSRPAIPTKQNLTAINTTISDLVHGQSYQWQVVAKNPCGQKMWSDTNIFKVRYLPDLIVEDVVIPNTGLSGLPLGISWQTRNNGPGSTRSQAWTDKVYLSVDATFNPGFDIFIGAAANLTALDSGEVYVRNLNFQIPHGLSGQFYVFVVADDGNFVRENNEVNNSLISSGIIIISLSPYPDLRVISVANPSNAFSGQSLLLEFTILNSGTGNALVNQWNDRVFLSTDSLNASGLVLKNIIRNGFLLKDSTYSVQTFVTLPPDISGDYFIHVYSDFNQQVYEAAAENNNSYFGNKLTITLTPPPDLIPVSAGIPDTIHNNQCMSFPFSLMNIGLSPTPDILWNDMIYLSKSPVFNPNFLHHFNQSYIKSIVDQDEMYTHQAQVCVNNSLTGLYYVYLRADAGNHINEFVFEQNNILKLNQQVFVANPDIQVASQVHSPAIIAGNNLTVNMTVSNYGQGHLINRFYNIVMYMSQDSVFVQNNAVKLSEKYYYHNINSGSTVNLTENITVPVHLNGSYYLHSVIDEANLVLEASEINNVKSSFIQIASGPTPDLRLNALSVPDTIIAGKTFNMSYRLENIGNFVAQSPFKNKIYLTFDSVFQVNNAILLHNATISKSVNGGSFVDIQHNFFTASALAENVYYIFIFADADQQLFESNESNNWVRSDAIYVRQIDASVRHASVDLMQDTLSSGNQYLLTKDYQRISDELKVYNFIDRVYVSSDTILDSNDLLITEFHADCQLLQTQDYLTIQHNIFIPNGLNGNYYVISFIDAENVNMDNELADNINLVRNTNGQPKLIYVSLSPYPDLIVSDYQVENTLTTGINQTLSLSVRNGGTAICENASAVKFYLSADANIGPQDLLLGSVTTPVLDVNQETTSGFTVSFPSSYTGNFFILVLLDANNNLFEHIGESNNLFSIPVTLVNPPPGDLIIENLNANLSEIYLGEELIVAYELKNSGINLIQGNVDDILYLSTDPFWSIDDQYLGEISGQVTIVPGNSVQRTDTFRVLSVIPGLYYLVARTDVKQMIFESNENNNQTASELTFSVDAVPLYMDIPKEITLQNNISSIYKLFVSPDLNNETIEITLNAPDENVINEIYASYGYVPDRVNFDFVKRGPGSKLTSLWINSAIPGYYYISTYGVNLTSNLQTDTLLAKVVPFRFDQIFPDRGVVNTTVTTKQTGTKFMNTPIWRLRRNEPYEYVPAENVFITDQNTAFVTYNLTNAALDTFSVDAVKVDSTMATIEKSFRVMQYGFEDLQIQVSAPGAVGRANRPIKIEIRYQNAGNTDLINPRIAVTSVFGNKIASSVEELYAGGGVEQLVLQLNESGAPPGRLRPSGSGYMEVFMWSVPYPTFGLKQVE